MENQREAQEMVKADVEELKGQMGQILEVMKVLQSQ